MSRPLDSREFKLILKPNLFTNFDSGISKLRDLIDTQVKQLNGTFESLMQIEF